MVQKEHHSNRELPKLSSSGGKPKRLAGSAKPKVVNVLIVKRPKVFAARQDVLELAG